MPVHVDIDSVRVAARIAGRFVDMDLVVVTEQAGGDQAADTAADDGDFHSPCFAPVCCSPAEA